MLPPHGHQIGRVQVGVHAPGISVGRDGLAGIKDKIVVEVCGFRVVEGGDGLGVVFVNNLEQLSGWVGEVSESLSRRKNTFTPCLMVYVLYAKTL